ncbi:probable WRKY transcription factor 48 [Amborella trichopoda]|uniref:WRKY domain-containing protein n=1 Tax=Amborella trichopoda TaxID=13333 RepID=W1P6L2_AMBTC|nr:probable WRKY transcription factor 48 [Amborella trichopoda]ERN03304.1 hypothetical protein AMTR_s00003p00229970 [Amborella trichopoda]|eukprot:XP_006841629.1 probable WRKY transcription factor 48 [Amborella trichopoda]
MEEEEANPLAGNRRNPASVLSESAFGGDFESSTFTELLGIHDFSSPFMDFAPPLLPEFPIPSLNSGDPPENSNLPATPNSSISSSSTEANEDDGASRNIKDEQEKVKKVSKPKKKTQKRQREPRVAFMTKSEVDHLEDGYRWRKYGQKAVKNSPYPRSYYRCTSPKCGVKKRVERSFEDPSTVITTYEGQHTHQSPASLRGGGGAPSSSGSSSSSSMSMAATLESGFGAFPMQMMVQRASQDPNNTSASHSSIYMNQAFSSLPFPSPFPNILSRFCNPTISGTTTTQNIQAQLRDHGLLQDIVPSDMRKDT